jgi:hypothetical protein
MRYSMAWDLMINDLMKDGGLVSENECVWQRRMVLKIGSQETKCKRDVPGHRMGIHGEFKTV